MLNKLALAFCAAFILSLACVAQEPPAKPAENNEPKPNPDLEKKALKLPERIATDARSLKLAENRVYLFAIIGDMLWTRDEKRARGLFRDAANDLLLAMAENKGNGEEFFGGDFFAFSQMRTQFLQMVAPRDPELALELMRSTRPPKGEGGIFDSFLNNERRMEQSLAIAVIARDPKKALEIARESLAQGISTATLDFLRKLQDKDQDAAKQFAGDIIGKLKTENFTRNFEASFAAQALLRLAANVKENNLSGPPAQEPAKPLALDEKQLRELADLVVNAALNPSPLNPLGAITLKPLLPTLEKIAPERAAQLKQKIAETETALPPEMRRLMNAGMNTEAADKGPETAFEPQKDVPAGLGTAMRRGAVSRMVSEGNYDRAKQLINEKTEGRERDDLLEALEAARADKALREGKFDELKKIAAQTAGNGKRAALFAKIAKEAFAKKDQELAQKSLDEALDIAPRYPESFEDLNNVALVARACAVITPDKAFDLLAPSLDIINELLSASALLEKYSRRGSSFRDGELRFRSAFSGLGGLADAGKDIGLLAAADFERSQTLVDRLRREDARLLARLLLAQGVLAGKFGLSRESNQPDLAFVTGVE
jgi:hypothetical protein